MKYSLYICMCVHTHTYTVCICIHIYVYMCVCVYVCICIHIYIYMCVYVCVCIYTHTVVYNSIKHHLHTASCAHCLKQSLFPSPFPSFPTFNYPLLPSPLSPHCCTHICNLSLCTSIFLPLSCMHANIFVFQTIKLKM